jgi:hypothetical protein
MMETDIQEKIIFRYLLGDLPEAEQLALEQEFFAEEEKLEQIWALENQLLDRYVRGGLTPVERNLFEKNYLASPVHRQRLAFAETLVQAVDAGKEERARNSEKPHSVAWWAAFLRSFRGNLVPWSLAAATLLLVAGGFWLFTESARLRAQLNQLNDERASDQRRTQELETEIAMEREQRDRLTAELELLRQKQAEVLNQQTLQTPPHQVEHHSLASFFLSPLNLRSEGEAQQLKIPKETTEVRLQMKIQEPEARNFRVDLRTVEGAVVWSGSAGKTRAPEKTGSTVAVRIPVNKFSANEYILTLSAHSGANQPQEIARYFFRVIKP